MGEKINILGIQIDNCTVREAMLLVEAFLNRPEMNTIEAISMETLVRAGEDEIVKATIEQMDLSIISEKEILKTTGILSPQRMKETMENQFLLEFTKQMIKKGKGMYLLGETGDQLLQLQGFLNSNFENLNILGSYATEECVGDFDGAVNEINIASTDIILSILTTPLQEHFLSENKGKLNAEIWYGLGENYARKKGITQMKTAAKKIIQKGMIKSRISKYNDEE